MKHNRIRKVVSAFVLVACMIFAMLPVPVLADPVGTEIPADAIYISTPEDLLALAENCRVNTWSVGKTVVLSNDIDMSGTEFSGIPTFGGTFMGQEHIISGLNIVNEGSVVGFFRYLQETAVVENLTLQGTIQPEGSKSVVGGFAGQNAGTIRNSAFNGTISGYEQVGGMVGVNETSGVIEECTIIGTISGSHFVGGAAGENHGVIRATINTAEINTKSVQNSVQIEDITLESFASTEDASTATDIGGIAGANSGVIRGCTNHGAIGYQSMGYNVGGIAGSQTGYMVDCTNNADIQGRKEVGGIVGHMEPNISLDYDADSLQILSAQLEALSAILNDMQATIESGTSEISDQMNSLSDNIDTIQDAIDIITTEIEAEEPDWDKITAAMNDLSDSLGDAMNELVAIQETATDMMSDVTTQLDSVVAELEDIIASMETMDENLDLSITDVSGNDTDEDTLGKVSNCWNYGSVTGDQNVGGIAGVMAEETDLEAYEDVEVSGNISLNGTYQTRVVIRDCRNYGTVAANKQYAGGITGQMIMGAVLECVNLGNLDCINADYVGGIAGDSYAIIRNSSSKSIISGDRYVGGIAGNADEVTDCYAFVSMEAYSEKAGAIVGYTDDIPTGSEDDSVKGNYYFISGMDIGGIDGISYTGATEKKDLEGFLQLPNLDDALRTVNIRFVVEGQEDTVLSVNVGESLAMESVPVLTVEANSEYHWEVVPAVTSEVLGMGETATVDYISSERLTNILFDQTYEATFDLKNTVIQVAEKSENGLAILLATGNFSKNTTIEMVDLLKEEAEVDGKEAIENWSVTFSNTGVAKIHYYIPADMNANAVKLLVKGADGQWMEREFIVDGSYFVFDFTDGETAFALVADYSGLMVEFVIGALIIIVGAFVAGKVMKKKRKAKAE